MLGDPHLPINSKQRGAEFSASVIFAAMKLQINTVTRAFGMLSAATLIHGTAMADEQMAAPAAASSSVATDTRYGLFDGLDHRSSYGQYFFPEPLLVGETD